MEHTAEKDALCIECGDHRGWRVEPDWNTGDAVQVQCRACTEHVCPPAETDAAPTDAAHVADDLFAGAGGWDLGAAALGIHARGVEIMPEARATRDAAGLTTIHDDVWTFWPDGRATGKIASPPCPTFSTAGKGTGRRALDSVLCAIDDGAYRDLDQLREYPVSDDDDRTRLVLTPLHFATQHEYEWLAWEQVPAVLPVWEACAEVLRADGWHVWTGILYSEEYAVAQTRKRAGLLASRVRPVGRPVPTHSRYYSRDPGKLDLGVHKWVSMVEEIGWGLPSRPAFTITGGSSHAASGIEWGGASVRKFMQAEATSGDPARWVLRNNNTANAAVRPIDHPAPTLYFGQRCNYVAWEREGVDPKEAIRLTPAEAGILQSFPADFPWQGTKGKRFLQVGNAVPPRMAMHALAVASGVAIETEEAVA